MSATAVTTNSGLENLHILYDNHPVPEGFGNEVICIKHNHKKPDDLLNEIMSYKFDQKKCLEAWLKLNACIKELDREAHGTVKTTFAHSYYTAEMNEDKRVFDLVQSFLTKGNIIKCVDEHNRFRVVNTP